MKVHFACFPAKGIASLCAAASSAALAGGLFALAAVPLRAQSPVQIAKETNAQLSGKPDAASTTASRVIARVDGFEIKAGDREAETDKLIYQQLQLLGGNLQGVSADQINMVRDKAKTLALQNLIDVQLIKAAKEKSGIKASDADIAAAKKQMIEDLKGLGVTYDQFLGEKGLTEADVMKGLGEQVEIKKMLEARTGALTPTEEQEKAFYEQHKDEMNRPESVRSSHILIKFPGNPRDPNYKPPTDAEKAPLKKKAEDILAQVKAGGDFAELAKKYSEDEGSKVQGGDLGPHAKEQMVKPFADAEWGLKPGEVSGIVESQFGYHIIKVTEHTPAGLVPFGEVKPKIEQYMTRQRFTDAITSLKEELRKSAKIEYTDKADQAAAAAAAAPDVAPVLAK